MKNHSGRLSRLEAASGAMLSDDDLMDRINRVLACPQLVAREAYDRILQILENCKQRRAAHEQP
jgi:hypothetical protein